MRTRFPSAAAIRCSTSSLGAKRPLSMRAAFHSARLLIERGALHQAAPLLSKIIKHNPAHRAARQLFDQITNQPAFAVRASAGKELSA